jgi:ferritin-like metal-binding protein YciE
MPSSDLDEQLNKYLSDAHSIEEQALVQMRAAPDIAGEPSLREAFALHLTETQRHERLVRERLEARGGTPSRFKKLAMALGGEGFVLFARSQPDTPGKLTAHAYSYEALEQGAYEMLGRVAARAGDDETVRIAREILADEYAMGERLAERFDRAALASLPADVPEDALEKLGDYLADAHALERQSTGLLEHAQKIAGDPELAATYAEHLDQTRGHLLLLEARMEACGTSPSMLKDAAMRLGALNWSAFFAVQPDTPGKLAVFAYAFEHLEIAGYELLARVADHAGDGETAETARLIAAQEREAARLIQAGFDRALDASLEAQGVV